MRNPDRIPIVLEEIRKTWELTPDLRLGQLIVNMARKIDPFFIEDEDLIRELKIFRGDS